MILALDVAGRTGVCLGRAGETPRAMSVDLGKGRSEGARLSRLLRLVRETITRFEPDLLVYELPVGGRDTSHLLVGMAAVVVAQATDMGLEPVSAHSATVRKFFLGYVPRVKDFPGLSAGKAKAEIKRLVVARCHALGWTVPDTDAADAAATWAFACHTHAGAALPPPGGLF